MAARRPSGGKAKAKAKLNADDTPMDPEELKQVFRRIDLDNSGTLEIEELETAARELGIRCSKNSMKKVFKMIDADQSGSIDFDEFSIFFAKVNNPERIKEVLSDASASFLDYRNSVEQDPSFAKHFPMPRSVKSVVKYNKHFNATVEAVRWVADGTALAATGEGKLLVFDVASHMDAPIKQCEVGPSVYCMDAVPGGRGVLLGYGKKSDNLVLWNMAEEQVVQRFEGQSSAVFSCCLSSDFVLSGSKEGLVVLNDIETGTCIRTWQVHEGLVNSLSLAADGHQVVSTSRDGHVTIFDINAGSWPSCQVSDIEDAAAGYTVCHAIWCGHNQILSAGDDYCVKRWDIRNQRDPPLDSYMGHTSCVRSLALSPDGTLFASGAADSSVRLWALSPTDLRTRMTKTEDGEKVSDLLADLKQRREQVIELVHAGEGDPAEIRELNEEIEHLEKTAQDRGDQELIDAHGYIRAVLGLSGHSLTVGSLAWQDFEGGHRLLSGAQDEAMCCFEFKDDDIMTGLTQMSRQCSPG
ncbi:unnamed protein product [Effrenium voratum]|nr:unnamed protein product [Effrenium voratum]